MLAPKLITPPASLPVTRDQAKLNCNVTHDDDNDLFDLWIAAATEVMDGPNGILGRCLITQTWEQAFEASDRVTLPFSPVSQIVSVTYIDQAGITQTIPQADYEQSPDSDAFGPFLKLDTAPSSKDGMMKVRFIAGYGDASAVPASIRQAILLLISSCNEHREKDLALMNLQDNPNYKDVIRRIRLRRI